MMYRRIMLPLDLFAVSEASPLPPGIRWPAPWPSNHLPELHRASGHQGSGDLQHGQLAAGDDGRARQDGRGAGGSLGDASAQAAV
jgi:hypothetical protein